MSYSIEQLEALFYSGKLDQETLRLLFEETCARSTKRAVSLRERVGLSLKQDGLRTPIPPSSPPLTPRPEVSPPPTGSQPRRLKVSLTDEQVVAVEQFSEGRTLAINAFAGSGKTTTLQAIANSTSQRGVYLAFNRSIVQDSREKFGPNMHCSTIHGVAFRAMMPRYNSIDKMTKPINAHQLAELMGFREIQLDGNNRLKPVTLASITRETIRKFTQSAEEDFSSAFVPRMGATTRYRNDVWAVIEKHVRLISANVWRRMIDPNDPIPLGHDGYLKQWALSDPILRGEFILVDEAQDTNPVVLDVLQKQPAQLVFVGDKYQQIYEWRGAINAMEKVKADRTAYLTMSFRFGSEIADLATRILHSLGETRSIKGNSEITSKICRTQPTSILARTNSGAMSAVIDAIDAGRKPHLVGTKEELMAWLRGVQDLKNNKPSTESIFFGFQNWTEVLEFVREHDLGELTSFVNLVTARGERQLMWALNRTVEAEHAQVVISTAHKAKGREWANVRIADDFSTSTMNLPTSKPDHAECRLFYVAATRARNELDVSADLIRHFATAA